MHDALRPGGLLVMADANLLTDEPDRTGFDWGHALGAKGIAEVVAATPGLDLRRELRSALVSHPPLRADRKRGRRVLRRPR